MRSLAAGCDGFEQGMPAVPTDLSSIVETHAVHFS